MLRVQGRSGAPEGVPAGLSRRNAKRTQELGAAAARCRRGPNEVMRSRFRVRRRAGAPARRRPRIPSRFTISNTAPPRRLRHAQGRQGPPRRAASARERCYRRGRGAESTGCAKKMREIGKKFVWGCWLCCINGLGGGGVFGGRVGARRRAGAGGRIGVRRTMPAWTPAHPEPEARGRRASCVLALPCRRRRRTRTCGQDARAPRKCAAPFPAASRLAGTCGRDARAPGKCAAAFPAASRLAQTCGLEARGPGTAFGGGGLAGGGGRGV